MSCALLGVGRDPSWADRDGRAGRQDGARGPRSTDAETIRATAVSRNRRWAAVPGLGAGVGLALLLAACAHPASSGLPGGSATPKVSAGSSTNPGVLSGRVVDADGDGIAGVMVIAVPLGDAQSQRPPAAETGTDGAFEFDPIPAGRWHVAVMAGETEVASTDVDLPPTGDGTVIIVMEGP
jgi:carboxypeptidase family protein